ncbi:MAG: arylesterase [Verrucomicrobia bacterium]|nr:arylesterase [Verrucomicrobiota bacterium]
MRRSLFGIIFLLVIAGLIWFRASWVATYKNFPPQAGRTWLALGDSLTAGYGAGASEDYPSVLGELLGVEIKNLGVNGQTSGEGLERIHDALALEPGVALLCLGGNDGLRQLPPHEMFANLAAIIDRLHDAGAFVVLIGIRSANLVDKNEKRFRQLAKQKQVLYVPNILRGVLGEPDLMDDMVHPNARGYRVIAERLARELRPCVKKLVPALAK